MTFHLDAVIVSPSEQVGGTYTQDDSVTAQNNDVELTGAHKNKLAGESDIISQDENADPAINQDTTTQKSDCVDLTASDTAAKIIPSINLVDHDDDAAIPTHVQVGSINNLVDTVDTNESHNDCESHCDLGRDDDDDIVEFEVDVQVSDDNNLISSLLPEEFEAGFNTAIYTSAGREIPCHSGKVFTKKQKKGTLSIVFVQALLSNTKIFDENIATYYVGLDEFQKWRDSNAIGTYLHILLFCFYY